jgi:hypothetical protein
MSKLYRDILYLIFEELQDDKKSLALCLTVNKNWCEVIIPILWKNPWRYYLTNEKMKLLLNTIILHLSDEAKNDLSQNYDFFTISYKKPSFNYISFCKHLNLEIIENIIEEILNTHINFKEIKNDILNLFINENMEYTHLYISQHFDYHFVPGAELCFSKIESLKCNDRINDKFLSLLTKVCKSIKELKLFTYEYDYNYGIAKLIENQKNLFSISFLNDFSNDNSSRKIIGNSLVKHANTIQYFSIREQFVKKVLMSFVNLKILELIGNRFDKESKWDNIKDLFLPSLQNLNASNIPINCLVNLIESSGRQLTKIYYYNYCNNAFYNKTLIQAIYHNCPNLIYLELLYKYENILELEKLLINCQCLKRLDFYYDYLPSFCQVKVSNYIEWDNLFNVLANSSPPGLSEFVFKKTDDKPELESLKLFFDNWEGRQPITLKFDSHGSYRRRITDELIDLIERYKEKGVVKKYVCYYISEDNDLIESYKERKVVKTPKTRTKTTSIWSRFKMIFN